jgi:hypothetical protein
VRLDIGFAREADAYILKLLEKRSAILGARRITMGKRDENVMRCGRCEKWIPQRLETYADAGDARSLPWSRSKLVARY